MSGFVTPTTSAEPADQPLTAPIVASGTTGDQLAQVAKTLLPTGSAPLYTFATEWRGVYNGQTLTFRPGVGYAIDPALNTFLTAAGAVFYAV